jgi:hypothetical protein
MLGPRNLRAFLTDRSGSGTARLAVGALALPLASLILGDRLARLAQDDALPKLSIARRAPFSPGKGVDFAPTAAIPDKVPSTCRARCADED